MYSICKLVVEQDALDGKLRECAASEGQFTLERGVLERSFLQCVQQPHVIWARTRWTTEKAHNTAAAELMKVRLDDRVASAYFRPGLYFEMFAKERLADGLDRSNGAAPGLVLVCHGLVADKKHDAWKRGLGDRVRSLSEVPGLLRCRTFYNYGCPQEFVGFIEWRDDEAYAAARAGGELTPEEVAYVGPVRLHSDLASYIHYECRRLDLRALATS